MLSGEPAVLQAPMFGGFRLILSRRSMMAAARPKKISAGVTFEGSRMSAARAFLKLALARKNLRSISWWIVARPGPRLEPPAVAHRPRRFHF